MGEWDNYCDEIGGVCKDMEAQAARIAELEREIKFLKTEMTCWDSYIKELEKKVSGNE